MTEAFPVPDDRVGLELDEFLCLLFPGRSKGFVRGEIRAGRVKLDGGPAHPSSRLRQNQVVLIEGDPEEWPEALGAHELPDLPILHEDSDLLAIDKPAGLAAEPERWDKERLSLASALLALARERSRAAARADAARTAPAPRAAQAAVERTDAHSDECEASDSDAPGADEGLLWRPRLVHRLDKDTTGVVLVAKNLETERALRTAFEEGRVHKRYLALVEGEYPLDVGEEDTIDLPLSPDPRRGGRMRVDTQEGKSARTVVSLVERFRGYSLVACRPLTGRTHQIRVHLCERGFPLAVDALYGRRRSLALSELKAGYRKKPGHVERPLIERHTLHASELELEHHGAALRVHAPLPADFERLRKALAKWRPAQGPRSRA